MKLKKLSAVAEFSPEEVKKISVYKSEHYEIKAICFEEGQKIPPHSHAKSDEMFQVVKGKARIKVGKEEWEAVHGTVVIGKAGIPHSVENIGNERLLLKSIFVPPLD